MDSEKQVEVLTRLGLTVNQAKIFIALAQLEPSTATQIARTANLAREVVYRTIPILQKMGLITRTISFPTLFTAVSPELAIKILLRKREKDTNEAKTEAAQLIKQLSHRFEHTTDNQVISITGKERLSIFVRRRMLTIKTSLDTMMTYSRFHSWLSVFKPMFKKLLAKKVIIRVIIVCDKGNIDPKKLDLIDDPNFMVKFIPDQLQTFVGISDDKDTMINTSIGKFSFYWSNDTGIVALSRIYFDKYWASAEISPS
ncbi:MAG: TrmB family transcriptional regulator [Candidatus Bathyarchaeia archaeon]